MQNWWEKVIWQGKGQFMSAQMFRYSKTSHCFPSIPFSVHCHRGNHDLYFDSSNLAGCFQLKPLIYLFYSQNSMVEAFLIIDLVLDYSLRVCWTIVYCTIHNKRKEKDIEGQMNAVMPVWNYISRLLLNAMKSYYSVKGLI